MNRTCKIIMYHYVRPIKNSKDPKMKGLEVENFERQVDFFIKKFKFITADQLIESIYENKDLPQNSIILTFDDGLNDHHSYVFPILKKKKIQGLFFPPAEPIIANKVLDVHKIHFILARWKNQISLIKEIFDFINSNRKKYNLRDPKKYFSDLAVANRFDSQEIIFVKRILQRDLPKELRSELTDKLFKKVSSDEEKFAENFYLTFEQIAEMRDAGMFFGSHGFRHEWLSYLNNNELDKELAESIKFLTKIKQKKRIMCYPYGDFDERVISKIKEFNFKIGLTSEVGEADLKQEYAFKLKRYDTNDFPQ